MILWSCFYWEEVFSDAAVFSYSDGVDCGRDGDRRDRTPQHLLSILLGFGFCSFVRNLTSLEITETPQNQFIILKWFRVLYVGTTSGSGYAVHHCQNAKIPTLDKTFYKTSYSRFILSNLYLRIVYIMTGFLAFWHITSSRYYHVTSRYYHVIYHCIYAVKIFLYIWYHIFISPTSQASISTSNIQWNLTKINLYS